jgi:tetratricopeptide (TPR) repeat protein
MTPKSRRLIGLSVVVGSVLIVTAVLAWHGYWIRQFDVTMAELRRDGDVRRARQVAEAMSRQPGFAAHAKVIRGACLVRTREFIAAYHLLSDFSPPRRLRHPVLLLIGESLYHSGDLVNSERAFRQAAIEKPDSPIAHRWLAGLYHEVGAMWGALGELQEVVRIDPRDQMAYALMGQLYAEDFGRPKEACEQFRKALELDPTPEQAQAIRRELAGAQIALNDFEGALKTLKSADEDVGVLAMKAECHWNLRDPQAAGALLERAKSLSPKFRAILLLEARMQTDRGDASAAVELLKSLLDDDPHDFTSRYQLAQAYRLLGETDLSQAELARMQESKDLRNRLNSLYEQAIKSPLDAAVREELANTCDRLGKHELAAKWRRASSAAREAESYIRKP